MKEIDWSKAPEGFPIWIEDLKPDLGGDHSCWARELSDRYEDEKGGFWSKPEDGFYRVHRRPWTGEGLPPVGTALEFRTMRGEWIPGEYIGQFNGQMVVGCKETGAVGYCDPEQIRPVRTPEQIAAEEREKAVDEMLAAHEPWIAPRRFCEKLYDAGYRRQEPSE